MTGFKIQEVVKKRYTKKQSSYNMFLLTSQSFVIKIQFFFTKRSDVTLTCNFGWTPRHECREFILAIECRTFI